jgi:hypothetical protein
MKSGLYVCIKDIRVPTYWDWEDSNTTPVIWRKGTVVHESAFDVPPDPEYWKDLYMSTANDSVLETK